MTSRRIDFLGQWLKAILGIVDLHMVLQCWLVQPGSCGDVGDGYRPAAVGGRLLSLHDSDSSRRHMFARPSVRLLKSIRQPAATYKYEFLYCMLLLIVRRWQAPFRSE